MNLNSNSWYAILYKQTYSVSQLPDNLCAFFWKMLYAVILLPVTWVTVAPSLVCNRHDPDKMTSKIWISLVLNIMGFVLYGAIVHSDDHAHAQWYWPFLGILIMAAFVFIFFLLFTLIDYIGKTDTWQSIRIAFKRKDKPYKKPRTWILVEFIKATKYKYCPRIEWTSKTN